MKNNSIYQSAQGSLLFERGFRIDNKGNWRCHINGDCGLSSREQRTNEKGGMILGRDTPSVFFSERNNVQSVIRDYTDEEIAESKELSAINRWLKAALKA